VRLATIASHSLDDSGKPQFLAFKRGGTCPKWVHEMVDKVHGDRLPDNTICRFILAACQHFSNLDIDSKEYDLLDSTYTIEPDVYTRDLTAWLNESVYNVEYLTMAMENCHNYNGVDTLEVAQTMQRREVARLVLDFLVKYKDSLNI
jgi:hypothetical protein